MIAEGVGFDFLGGRSDTIESATDWVRFGKPREWPAETNNFESITPIFPILTIITMNPRPTLYVLDSFSLIYQVFHAIPLMTSPAGQPTNAVFGVFRDLLNLLKTRKPDYLAAAFDGEEKTKRAEAF